MIAKTVWKYEFHLIDEFAIEMPKGARVLAAQEQYGSPMMWALVDPTQPVEMRRFRLAGTGHKIDNADHLTYVGTLQLQGGGLVFHLFERVEATASSPTTSR